MASTSSATSPPKKHQVFLSFRGTDTRDNFVSFLHRELDRNGIETYIDNRLQGGEVIEPALLRKIEESLISVVILSKHYADSTFCLREVWKILQCKKKGQIVIPVFYQVAPDDVGNLRGRYRHALSKHEKKCSLQEVSDWRQALEEIAELKGWDSNVTKPDTELTQQIVDDIQKKLEQIPSSGSPSSNSRRLVGIASRVKDIESLLSFESTSVLIVGIWGMGGIGKTTTAKAVYDRNLHRFDGACFFKNSRKESQKHGLQEILREALKKDDLNIQNRASELWLQSKKILIVLDDVNSHQVLKDLVGEAGLLGKGSRIIVTSRDRQVLINECEEKIYEVQNLDEGDALKLFSLRAFHQENPVEGYAYLSKSVLSYVRGIPLVLEVLGCSLYKRSKDHWESKVEELRKNRGENIKQTLEMCYDELRWTDKKTFLDIACFFRRCSRNLVQQTLDLEDRNGIDRLIDMCLIKIVDNNKIWMHDVLQQLGREIVLKEHNNSGERSRLWEAEDVDRILQNRQGTAKVEAILYPNVFSTNRMNFSPTAFEGMDNLRLLKLENEINFRDGLEFLSNKLRSLCWYHYPLPSLPSTFSGDELVELDMSRSQVERLWNDNQNENRPLTNLKFMNLSGCHNLGSINLSKFPNLEVLNLAACSNLVELPGSIKHCTKLTKLYLSNCSKLASLPDSIGGLECLTKLDLHYCSKLASLPNSISQLKCLAKLNLSYCSKLASLLNSIGQLKYLAELNLSKCSELTSLPNSIVGLECLANFDLSYCSKLASLPNSIGQLKCLDELNLSYCSELASLPDSIGGLECLAKLNLYHCSKLASLPNSIGLLKCLAELNLYNCSELASLPDSIGGLECLAKLNLSYCSKLASLPNSIGELKCLVELSLSKCSNLTSLPDSIVGLECLAKLDLYYCSKLASLPNSIGQLKCLAELNLSNCSELASLPDSIGGLECLAKLNLYHCSKLASLPNSIGWLKCLAELDLYNCSELASLPDSIGQLKCLIELHLFGCHKLASLPNNIKSLECLRVQGCPVMNWSSFVSLRELVLFGHDLKTLPENIRQLPKLIKLVLVRCQSLQRLPELPSSLRFLQASGCYSLESIASLFPQGEKYEAGYEDFNFADCYKLGENECLKIMNDARYRIQRLATSLFNQGRREQSIFRLCIPGSEVPKWFSHINAEGFSIENIEQLPAHLHRISTSTDQFLGLAFCAVVAFKQTWTVGLDITCDLITEDGHRSHLCSLHTKGGKNLGPRFRSEHVFLGSIISNCHFEKASFHFNARAGIREETPRVVKCGVHLLFSQDDIDEQPHPKKLKKNV